LRPSHLSIGSGASNHPHRSVITVPGAAQPPCSRIEVFDPGSTGGQSRSPGTPIAGSACCPAWLPPPPPPGLRLLLGVKRIVRAGSRQGRSSRDFRFTPKADSTRTFLHVRKVPQRRLMQSQAKDAIRSPRRRGRAAVGGMMRPSSFAAFRLTAIWSLVGNSTGKSFGLAPFRNLCT